MSSVIGTQSTAQNLGAGGTLSQYMSFLINDRSYAISLSQVAEITPYCELNQMPHTPKCVEGLLDLRGQVLPIVSLRTIMRLPKKETHKADSIIILTHEGSRIGVLVDQVESVITANEEHQMNVSPLLEGRDGTWVKEILLMNGKVILVLEPESLLRISQNEALDQTLAHVFVDDQDIELKLDEGLRNLIALADSKPDEKVVPQIESVINHTEQEMSKVIERIESMLSSTDAIFTGIGRFKQEVAIDGLKGFDGLGELDKTAQELQDRIFDVIQQLQFQDIIRQKLERVLRYIMAMNNVISTGIN